MKLAEALILRADQQKRIAQLTQRIMRNAKVQEGDAPAENPSELIRELESIAAALLDLVRRINRTNSQTPMAEGGTIADAIARRDNLRLRADAYRQIAEAAMITQSMYTRTEIKFQSTLNVAEMQQKADQAARAHRELDAAIQALNWSVDLAD